MPQLKAIRPLNGKYGHIHPGGFFTTDEETALALEARGLASRYMPPRPPAPEVASFVPTYDTKVITKRK